MMRVQHVCAHVYLHKWVVVGGGHMDEGYYRDVCGRTYKPHKYSSISKNNYFFFFVGLDKTDREKHAMTVLFHIKLCLNGCSRKLWLSCFNNWKSASALLLISCASDETPYVEARLSQGKDRQTALRLQHANERQTA